MSATKFLINTSDNIHPEYCTIIHEQQPSCTDTKKEVFRIKQDYCGKIQVYCR